MQPKFKQPVQNYLAASAVLASAFSDGDDSTIESAIATRESALVSLAKIELSSEERDALRGAESHCRQTMNIARAEVLEELEQVTRGRTAQTRYTVSNKTSLIELTS